MNNIKSIYTFLRSSCHGYILINLVFSVFEIICSYINMIIIASLLLDIKRIILEKQFFIKIFVFIVFNLLSIFISGYLNKKIKIKNSEINKHFDLELSEAISEMKYQKLESYETQNAIHRIKEGKQKAGDFSSFIKNFFEIFVSLAKVSIGIGLLLFYTIRNTLAIEYATLNYFLKPSFLIIILLSVIIAFGVFERKEQQNDFVFFETFEPIIKKYNYYINFFMDYERSKDIRINRLESKFENELFNYFNEEERQIWELYNRNKKLHYLKELMFSLAISSVYFIAASLFFLNLIEINIFYILINCTILIIYSSKNLFSHMWQVKYFTKYYKYFFNFANKNSYQKGTETTFNGLKTIEFQNVSYKYENTEKNALEGINLLINNGEKIALVGGNGSGKSTLIKLLLGLYTPDSGKILINGNDINNINNINNISSVVHQDFSLISASVLENIILINDKNEIKLKKVAQDTKIENTLLYQNNSLIYKNYDTNGVLPSGGEEQRIALARMFYKDGKLLILDEPTAALDVFSEIEFYKLFSKKEKEKIKILISHRLISCATCDRIVVLKEGKIIEEGTHKELLNSNGEYRKMWDIENSMYHKIL